MIEFKKKTLTNGLTVIAHTDPVATMAAVNILYKVGSRNENPEQTGFAHLFEHLMFGGSANVPDFDEPILMASGENNAFTNNDYTNYYIAIPSENLETALWVESDRMAGLSINEHSLEVQRRVVVEEFAQRYLNQPYGDLWLELRPLCYTVHPYQWATIGKRVEHIQDAQIQDVQRFYDRYYTPQNAVLCIAGNFSEEYAFEMAEKWFGGIPAKSGGAAIVDDIPAEPEQTAERRLRLERDVPADVIYMAYKMCGRREREFDVCDVLSDVLSNGNSSRLYQRLVRDRPLFTSVNAYVTSDIDPGLFVVTGKLLDGVSFEVAEEALLGELELLQQQEVSAYELEKVLNKFEATTVFNDINVLNKAMNLCFYEYLGDAELINHEVQSHRSITTTDLLTTARSLFRPEKCNVLYYAKK